MTDFNKGFVVRGEERAAAMLLGVGLRAGSQAASMRKADTTTDAVEQGQWNNRTGRLTAALEQATYDDDGLTIATSVPYAPYVFFGTKYVRARPPIRNEQALADAVCRAVADDLVGE